MFSLRPLSDSVTSASVPLPQDMADDPEQQELLVNEDGGDAEAGSRTGKAPGRERGTGVFGRSRLGDSSTANARLKMFWFGVVLIELISVLIIAPLATVWCVALLEGETTETNSTVHLDLVWSGGNATFNWHPFFMIWTFGVILVQSMLSFRVLSRLGLTDKDRLKQIHFSIHLFSLVLICIGLAATFDFHTHEDKPHLTTMHSWLGLMTVLAFVGLFSMGVVFYCTERFVGYKLRKVSVHWHKLAGISVLLLSGTAIVTGIQEAAEHHTEHPGIGYPGQCGGTCWPGHWHTTSFPRSWQQLFF